MKDPMDCAYPHHKLCISDDCSDGCKKKRGTLWRKRKIDDMKIDSISTVRLYRNAEGTVIHTEAVERISHDDILTLWKQAHGIELTEFLHLVRLVEDKIFLEASK
jgi:hypothetical protein